VFRRDGLGLKSPLGYFASEGDPGNRFQRPLAFRVFFMNGLIHVAAVSIVNISSGYTIGLDAHLIDG
jgi:hypothetical protein